MDEKQVLLLEVLSSFPSWKFLTPICQYFFDFQRLLSFRVVEFQTCQLHKTLDYIELVSKGLNHLAAILHVYAGGLIFMKNIIIFQKEKGNTFTLLIIFFIVKSLQKEQNSTNLLL